MLCLVSVTVAQSPHYALPDAPQPQPAPNTTHSGWALRNGKATRSNLEVLKDQKFKWFAIAQLGTAVLDAEVTHAGIAHHSCVEGNSSLDHYPSRASLYRNFALTDGAVVGLGFLVEKTIPRGKLTKVEKAASWIYPAMATYSMQVHARGAAGWLQGCW